MQIRRSMVAVVGFYCFCFVHVALAAQVNDPCGLPADLQRELLNKYPRARVVAMSDVQDDDRGFFEADHRGSCPGLTKVDFYGDGQPTLALLLIPATGNHTDLVVAHQRGPRWRITFLGTGGPSPYAPVVWSQPPDKYRDVNGKKKIQATKPVIVLCKYESWTILYAWTGSRVTKIWLSDWSVLGLIR